MLRGLIFNPSDETDIKDTTAHSREDVLLTTENPRRLYQQFDR